MWQKFLYSCFLIVLSGIFNLVLAQTVEVEALSTFSTAKPPASIVVKLMEPVTLPDGYSLKAGDVIHGNLVNVVSPKRLKRDATFSFKPNFYMGSDGNTHDIKSRVVAKYKAPLNKKQLAKSTALGVGNFFVSGLSMGVAAVDGAVNNKGENRAKSSAKSVYKASPFSYVERGEDLVIRKSQIFYLKFPNSDKSSDKKDKHK